MLLILPFPASYRTRGLHPERAGSLLVWTVDRVTCVFFVTIHTHRMQQLHVVSR
jgi:hypothetical protein